MKTLLLLGAMAINLGAFCQWNTIDFMGDNKVFSTTVSCGDSILIIGGSNFNTAFDIVEVYRPSSGTWDNPMTLSSPRGNTAAVKGDSAVYIAGGNENQSLDGTSVIDIYKNGAWTTYIAPDTMWGANALKAGSKILFTGGQKTFDFLTGDYSPSNLVVIYDELTGVWSTDTLAVPRCMMGTASDGNIAIFAGGVGENDLASDIVDIYNASTDSWTSATLSQARAGLTGAYANGKFLFAGGGDETQTVFDIVDIFDGTTWTTSSLSQARLFTKSTVTDSKIFFTGGSGYDWITSELTPIYNDVDIYDIASGTWSTQSLPHPLAAHVAFSSGETAYVAGGWDGTDDRADILSFNPYAGISEWQQSSGTKELVKIVDFSGRETEFKPNTPLIYIYNDGTVERVMKSEK